MVNSVKVPTFTPVDNGNTLSMLPALYLSPLFCGKEIAVREDILIVYPGSENCRREPHETTAFATAIKIATYILSVGILPLLAILLNYAIRCNTNYQYLPEASLIQHSSDPKPPAQRAPLPRTQETEEQPELAPLQAVPNTALPVFLKTFHPPLRQPSPVQQSLAQRAPSPMQAPLPGFQKMVFPLGAAGSASDAIASILTTEESIERTMRVEMAETRAAQGLPEASPLPIQLSPIQQPASFSLLPQEDVVIELLVYDVETLRSQSASEDGQQKVNILEAIRRKEVMDYLQAIPQPLFQYEPSPAPQRAVNFPEFPLPTMAVQTPPLPDYEDDIVKILASEMSLELLNEHLRFTAPQQRANILEAIRRLKGSQTNLNQKQG